MIENIVIREAVTEEERSLFWERLRAYFCRDIFPDPEDEDRPYFLGDDYRRTMESLRTRPVHPVHWLVFSRNGQDVGFALAAVFTGEDGKCFILEFCVLPEHRGGGMGTACARTLLNWAREQGAGYAELNCTTPPRQRFWGQLGFVANGADEWGVPLMLLPPREHRSITVERLTDPTDWQLGKLENGYRQDIGEEPLTEEQQAEFVLDIAKRQRFTNIDDFLAAIGYGGVSLSRIIPRIKEDYLRIYRTSEEEKLDKTLIRPKKERKAQSGVIVEGLDGCLVKFARCCNPLPGDEIVGFITRGFGVSIHKRDCVNVVNSINDEEQKERWVRAEWAENVRDSVFKSTLEIFAADRSDLLADVSIAIANMRIPLHSLSAREAKDHHVVIQITLGITHLEQLNNIISTFQRISGVISVERTNQ